MAEVPHFSLPFRFGPTAAVVEQDSIEEIASCVLAILLCPLGFRVELPQFGWDDPTFGPGVDLRRLRATVETWEERAQLALGAEWDDDDALAERVQVLLQVRTEE